MFQVERKNSMRSIIGMIAEVDDELSARVQIPYVSAIEQSGGLPILLPYVDGDETTEKFVDICEKNIEIHGKMCYTILMKVYPFNHVQRKEIVF